LLVSSSEAESSLEVLADIQAAAAVALVNSSDSLLVACLVVESNLVGSKLAVLATERVVAVVAAVLVAVLVACSEAYSVADRITSQTATMGTAIRAPPPAGPTQAQHHQPPTTPAVLRVIPARATRHPHLGSNTVKAKAMEVMGHNNTPRSHSMANSTDRDRDRDSMAMGRRLDSVDNRVTGGQLLATVKDLQQADRQVGTGNKPAMEALHTAPRPAAHTAARPTTITTSTTSTAVPQRMRTSTQEASSTLHLRAVATNLAMAVLRVITPLSRDGSKLHASQIAKIKAL